ncbi:hypothetical protein BASA83_013205 [Batrachochytrium salamandrivorans]|nr:hypothetical protein BASA83_013205 [Batrachochytrium salamandrivorans]
MLSVDVQNASWINRRLDPLLLLRFAYTECSATVSNVGAFTYSDLPETKQETATYYGSPFEILTDRGSAFYLEVKELRLFSALDTMPPTPYHPRTNGMVERMHAMETRRNPHSPFFLLYVVDPAFQETQPRQGDMMPLDHRADGGTRRIYCSVLGRNCQSDQPASARSKAQAEAMRIRNKWDPDSDDYYFKIGDMVKLKNHTKNKFEFDWKGPYHIVDGAIRERIG